MERLCFFIHLKPGTEEEYERLHREMYPEMTEALMAAGFTNYTLFRRDLLVVGYAECVPTVDEVLDNMGQADVTPRWNAAFENIIDNMTDTDGGLIRAHELWHLP